MLLNLLVQAMGGLRQLIISILDLRLQRLTGLEQDKIVNEYKEILDKIENFLKILQDPEILLKVIRDELFAVRDEYGDDRRSPIVSREAAQAMDETELISTDPITVVLSENGWVRAAKGHEVDPVSLNYKSGDKYLDSAQTMSNQLAVFIDSTGRTYAVQCHTLPSVKNQF